MNTVKIVLFMIAFSLATNNEIQHFRIRLKEPLIFIKKEREAPPQEENRNSQTFVNDVGFRILGEVDVHNLILYRQEYISLPEVLKNSIGSITITSHNLSGLCGLESPYKIKGCAISENNAIYLDALYRYGDLMHESIHTYSYQKGRVDRETFQNAYAREGHTIAVQTGNVQNIYEYFVSAYLVFMQDPQLLSAKAPLTYQYFLTC